MLMLKYFDIYVKYGLKPIAVYRNTKTPVGRGWNKDWSIDKWRKYFLDDRYNMGIILGDIIDVEGDSEEANELINTMTENIVHPMFRSSKSIHHLFRSPDPAFRIWKFQGMEIRGDGHQSVVPPSKHEFGEVYNWLKGTNLTIPDVPRELWQYYLDNRKPPRHVQSKPKIKEGYLRTECKDCYGLFYIHQKRLKIEVQAFRKLNMPWMCHGCRKIDVREICRTIRARM